MVHTAIITNSSFEHSTFQLWKVSKIHIAHRALNAPCAARALLNSKWFVSHGRRWKLLFQFLTLHVETPEVACALIV